jgi:hypothetical protein
MLGRVICRPEGISQAQAIDVALVKRVVANNGKFERLELQAAWKDDFPCGLSRCDHRSAMVVSLLALGLTNHSLNITKTI